VVEKCILTSLWLARQRGDWRNDFQNIMVECENIQNPKPSPLFESREARREISWLGRNEAALGTGFHELEHENVLSDRMNRTRDYLLFLASPWLLTELSLRRFHLIYNSIMRDDVRYWLYVAKAACRKLNSSCLIGH
jgi:hypothetical protein